MGTTTFDIFVQQEQEKTKGLDSEQFNPQKEKEDWLHYIDELYRMVSTYLHDYVSAGQVAVSYRDMTINEEYIGDYVVKQMLITIGTKVIRLEPVGTYLIGSKGRVDVVGPILRAQLMLVGSRVRVFSDMVRVSMSINDGIVHSPLENTSSVDWTWRLVTRPPERNIVELSQSTFLALLVEIGNG